MILRAIELRHVGPFRETVAVRDLDAEGLHVLAAPNEAGKSTFIRAVVR